MSFKAKFQPHDVIVDRKEIAAGSTETIIDLTGSDIIAAIIYAEIQNVATADATVTAGKWKRVVVPKDVWKIEGYIVKPGEKLEIGSNQDIVVNYKIILIPLTKVEVVL